MPVPHHSKFFFTGWMPFLLPNQQRQSTEVTQSTEGTSAVSPTTVENLYSVVLHGKHRP